MRVQIAVVLIAATALAGCSSGVPAAGSSAPSAAETDSDFVTVTYAFTDASVPPQYHRSVLLTVTRDTTAIVVDSYGDVLAEESAPTPPDVWSALDPEALAGLAVEPGEQGCTGGTFTSLEVVDGADRLVDLQADNCAGRNEATVAAINDWIAPARALFPPTDELAPTE